MNLLMLLKTPPPTIKGFNVQNKVFGVDISGISLLIWWAKNNIKFIYRVLFQKECIYSVVWESF